MAAAQTKGHEEDKHTGMQEKNQKREKKNEKRKVGSKAQSKQENRTQQQQIFPSLLQSRDGDLATPSAIFWLSSATVSSVTADAPA